MKNFLVGLVAFIAVTTGVILAADVGPKADVAAVRAAQLQKDPSNKIGGVHVIGNYAFVQWYGEGSGSATYKRVSGKQWKRIDVEGGVTGMSQLTKAGVPASIARQLCSGWGAGNTPCGNF
jgi:hypothetical protein